jgi:hypothetical protein
VALLRRLVEQGLSGAAIGAQMDLTKNQIVGACRRRGIRLQGNNNGGGCRTGRVLKPKPVPVVRKRKPVVAPVVVVPSPAPPMPPTRTCQWLDGSAPQWRTCAAPARPGTSWCEPHYRRVYGLRAERVA